MRNRHINKVKDTVEVEKVETVTEAITPLELPPRYVMFPDNLEAAVNRVYQIEEKLFKRGIKLIKPLKVYRYQKMLAIEVEKI